MFKFQPKHFISIFWLSFFLQSAQVYSPHIAFVLIFSTLMMACDVFHIDLVIFDWKKNRFVSLIKAICSKISANEWHRLAHNNRVDWIFLRFVEFIRLLLLWNGGQRGHFENEWLLVRERLVWPVPWSTKNVSISHQKYSKATLLPWIRCGSAAIGNITKSELDDWHLNFEYFSLIWKYFLRKFSAFSCWRRFSPTTWHSRQQQHLIEWSRSIWKCCKWRISFINFFISYFAWIATLH